MHFASQTSNRLCSFPHTFDVQPLFIPAASAADFVPLLPPPSLRSRVPARRRSLTSMFPHEARLRNLTYNSPLYCDISCKTYEADVGDRSHEEGVEAEEERENPKEFLGWVPIMLRSSFCVLVRGAGAGGRGSSWLRSLFVFLADSWLSGEGGRCCML